MTAPAGPGGDDGAVAADPSAGSGAGPVASPFRSRFTLLDLLDELGVAPAEGAAR